MPSPLKGEGKKKERRGKVAPQGRGEKEREARKGSPSRERVKEEQRR